MSYLDQETMSTRKMVSIGLVVVLHAILGYAFVTGLAFDVVKKVVVDLKTFDVSEAAPPPPPPPPDIKLPPPPVVALPPIVQIQSAPPPVVQVAPPPPVIAPPAPPPVIQPVRASPRGRMQELVTSDDYPSSSLRNNEAGTVRYRLDVGADGKVVACTVTSSSGYPNLDDTTCRLLQRRARFNAAKDSSGEAVASVWSSTVKWVIPRD